MRHTHPLFPFFPSFPSIFHVRVCHNVTARWLPESWFSWHATLCADNAKKKLIQELQEAWFFLVYLFCGLNWDRSRLNQEKDCWFSGPVQMEIYKRMNDTLDCQPSSVLKITTTKTTKNVLTHAHMLATGMCTAGVKKKIISIWCVCMCVRACVRVCVYVCVCVQVLYNGCKACVCCTTDVNIFRFLAF